MAEFFIKIIPPDGTSATEMKIGPLNSCTEVHIRNPGVRQCLGFYSADS